MFFAKRELQISLLYFFFEEKTRDTRIKCVIIFLFLLPFPFFSFYKKEKEYGQNSTAIQLHDPTIIIRIKLAKKKKKKDFQLLPFSLFNIIILNRIYIEIATHLFESVNTEARLTSPVAYVLHFNTKSSLRKRTATLKRMNSKRGCTLSSLVNSSVPRSELVTSSLSIFIESPSRMLF